MDECLVLVDDLADDDGPWLELVAVDPCVLHAGVTVTVTVCFGQLLQSTPHTGARGTAAVSAKKDAKRI